MKETAFQQALPQQGTELHIGAQTIRIVRESYRSQIAAGYEAENTSTGVHHTLKVAIPTDNEAWYSERRHMLKHEADVMRLLNRLEQVPTEGYRHIPLVDAEDTATISSDEPETAFAILLMELARGEQVEALLQTGEGLGEEVGLHIGCQLTDVVTLAHLGNFQCGAIAPARLHWDTRHLMVTDWQQTLDMTSLPDAEKTTGKQQDTSTLAALICWIIAGQPVPTNGSLDGIRDRLSPPLATLLERAINTPASFGTNPAPTFKTDLERLLAYWQEQNSYALIEQDIQEIKQEIAFLAKSTTPRSATAKSELIQRIDYLYEHLAIGKVRQLEQPWQTLEESLQELWRGQLALILGEIEAGNMDTALDLLNGMHAYPQSIHRQVLWRRRVAEACRADPRLAKERNRAVQAITEWDSGSYNVAAWINLDQKQIIDKLSQPARETAHRLQAELWIATLEKQYQQTPADSLEDRLTIISKMEKGIPEGIDPYLSDIRQQLCSERPRLEREQERITRAARVRQSLANLEQRVQKQDATLTDATFDETLADCTSTDDRRAVYTLRYLWQRCITLQQWLDDGDIPAALRCFASMGKMPDMLQARLQRQIVHKFLQIAGEQPGKEASYAEAFDRLIQRPVQTPADMENLLLYTGYLLPVIDAPRRKAYEELVERKERVLKNLALLAASEESLDTRIRAFHDLRSLGVHFLDDKILADSYGSYAVVQQQDQLGQLESVAEQMQASIQSLRMYESMAADLQNDIQALRDRMQPLPARLLEREVAEVEHLMPSKEAQHRHHQLWESTTGLAKTFQTIALQRDYFHVSSLVEVFRQRCPDNIQDVVLEYNSQELESLVDLAREIYSVHTRLSYAGYTEEIGDFINEQRERLNDQIARLLAYNIRKDDNETLALRIVAARRVLALSDALQGGVHDNVAWDDDQMQGEIIATYLRHRHHPIRRMMLRQLSPVAEVSAISMALAQPLPSQRMPFRAYAITGALVLVIIGLVFVMVQGMMGGGMLGFAAPAPPATTTTPSPAQTSLALDGDSPSDSPTAAANATSADAADGSDAADSDDTSNPATTTTSGDATASPTSGASFIPLESLTVTARPTAVQQPDLRMRSSTGTIELYQGETAQMRLTLEDTNNTSTTILLVWDDVPAGVTIDGDEQIELSSISSGSTIVDIALSVDKDAAPVARTIRCTAVTTDETTLADTQVYVIVNEYPPLMHTAMDVQEVLSQMLAITVTQNVTFRSEPIQSPTTQIEVLPEDTPLTVLSLDTRSGYLQVRYESDDGPVDGWVSTQDAFTTFDPEDILLDQYPLRVILGNALNAGNQAALYTTEARIEQDMEMVDAQEAELLEVIPVFEAEDEGYQLWVHVRLLDEDNPLEGWVQADDTNYEELVTTLAAELGIPS
jgi:hypothetical protein